MRYFLQVGMCVLFCKGHRSRTESTFSTTCTAMTLESGFLQGVPGDGKEGSFLRAGRRHSHTQTLLMSLVPVGHVDGTVEGGADEVVGRAVEVVAGLVVGAAVVRGAVVVVEAAVEVVAGLVVEAAEVAGAAVVRGAVVVLGAALVVGVVAVVPAAAVTGEAVVVGVAPVVGVTGLELVGAVVTGTAASKTNSSVQLPQHREHAVKCEQGCPWSRKAEVLVQTSGLSARNACDYMPGLRALCMAMHSESASSVKRIQGPPGCLLDWTCMRICPIAAKAAYACNCARTACWR